MSQTDGFRVVGDDETEPLPDASLDVLLTGSNPTHDIEFDTNRQLHRERFFKLGLECLLLIFGEPATAPATAASTTCPTTPSTATCTSRPTATTRIREHLGGVGAP